MTSHDTILEVKKFTNFLRLWNDIAMTKHCTGRVILDMAKDKTLPV